MLRHLGMARSNERGELARIERGDRRCIVKDCTAAMRKGAQNTVRLLQRLLYRSVPIGIRIAACAMADDEPFGVLAEWPCSRLAECQRVQDHMKRKGEGCRCGDPLPQASLMSARSEHRIHLAIHH